MSAALQAILAVIGGLILFVIIGLTIETWTQRREDELFTVDDDDEADRSRWGFK